MFCIQNEDGSIKSTHFTQVLGNDVFTIAFQAARAADPSVKVWNPWSGTCPIFGWRCVSKQLYINDYNLDSNNAKVAGIVALVKQLNSGGTKLVDGIGTQTHLSVRSLNQLSWLEFWCAFVGWRCWRCSSRADCSCWRWGWYCHHRWANITPCIPHDTILTHCW